MDPPQIKKFAQKTMKTSDVRIDVKLNKAVWSKGIRNVRASSRGGRATRVVVDDDVAGVVSLQSRAQSEQNPNLECFLSFPAEQVPKRIRVQIQRKHNDDKDAEEDLYSYVTVVDTPNGFKGLGTNVIEQDE